MRNRIIYSWYVSFDIWSQSNPVHTTITLYDQYYENNIWITHDNIIQNEEEDLEVDFNEAPDLIPVWLPQIEVYMDTHLNP